ncbi:MAG TPA: TIGR03560 family F420-dependent LLM class oxidoreductase [Candidatus Bathyarchaeia archaeon]|nr:TIGR03560 family F420-dependent LLM class oxidoreductase [Candidatus Bathyarchaeia archaeon]
MSLKGIIFGVHVPPEGLSFEEMKNICLKAEETGYDLFTITDHFMNMAQPDRLDKHPLECWSTLAGLAAITSKIRLGPLVSCYFYRQPTVLAKMATTIDIISNGRLIFGIGAGWHQKEFEGYMERFPPVRERMIGLEETIQICSGMFENERTNFNGKLHHLEAVLNSPPPVQRPLPIMVGGGGEKKTLRIAAKYADISHCAFNPSIETLTHKLDVLKKHCKAVNRDFNEIKIGISVNPFIGLTENEAGDKIIRRAQQLGVALDEFRKRLGPVRGTPEQCMEAMTNYVDRGVSLFTIAFPQLEDAKIFAKEIVRKLK